MNDYEELYEILHKIEKRVCKHRLFALPYDEAVKTVLRKLYVCKRIIIASKLNEEEIRKNLCNQLGLNHYGLDFSDYYQESLKWIFRWCKKFCNQSSEANNIKPEDVLKLMNLAYLYEKFYSLWYMHSKNILKVKIDGKNIVLP